MKKSNITFVVATFAAFSLGNAFADDLTIPNTFTAGTPAVAADVNANFSAVESSVDDNALNVTTAAQALSTVTANADANTANIATLSAAIASSMPGPSVDFVGFATAVVSPDSDFFGLNAACQAEFGSTAVMATTREIVDSNISTIFQSASGWIRSAIVQAASPGTSNSFVFLVDYSGRVTSDLRATCSGWTATGGRGMVLEADGGLRTLDCGTDRPVACSVQQ